MVTDHPQGSRRIPTVAVIRLLGADDLAQVRGLLADTAAAVGLGEDRAQRFAVAVSEVVTNAIMHGGGTANVMITGRGGVLTVEVTDRGAGLPSPAVPGLVPPTEVHGRGLWLAGELSDEMEISSTGAGTNVRLTMRC